ncbi:MAG TPA: SIMPL domain-containing protein [Candidatus Paceibacterota bacterium]|nr:SIMPL domain-containing protein [Candidatus Paceibacterota bacterium]
MFQELYMRRILATLGIVGIVALVAYSYQAFKQAEYMYHGPTVISVSGKGEVFAKPDVATFSFTVSTKEADAVTAQNKAADTMNGITAYLKDAGVDEKDIKTTSYNLSPRYEYSSQVCTVTYCPPAKEPKQIGFAVDQTVSVKVRDLDKAGEIVSQVGGKGATNVSGLSFTIDDPESLRAEARAKAIDDAKAKGKVLANELGTHIVRMSGYWEDNGGPIIYGMGKGGAVESAAVDQVAPRPAELPTGENTITVNVTLNYEIR